METSPLIPMQFTTYHVRSDYHDFAWGRVSATRVTPGYIAWQLENDAATAGWTVGRFMGLESQLIKRFDVSRDTLREAIRLLESRGSMVMGRGRNGGLRLAEPNLDRAAAAFAMYLRARGEFKDALANSPMVLDGLRQTIPSEHTLYMLYKRTLAMLSEPEVAPDRQALRGFRIAMRCIQHYSPIPNAGTQLGREDMLCERFSCSRATFRQALRILDDFGMLAVQRGRGGGYSLKRPSPIAIVRQLFGLLASKQQTTADLVSMKWALDVAKVQLAHRALQRAPADRLREHISDLYTTLDYPTEPYRWCLLHREIGRIAADPMVSALLWCIVAYDVRRRSPQINWDRIDAPLREQETLIVRAIEQGSEVDAKHEMIHAQELISGVFMREGWFDKDVLSKGTT